MEALVHYGVGAGIGVILTTRAIDWVCFAAKCMWWGLCFAWWTITTVAYCIGSVISAVIFMLKFCLLGVLVLTRDSLFLILGTWKAVCPLAVVLLCMRLWWACPQRRGNQAKKAKRPARSEPQHRQQVKEHYQKIRPEKHRQVSHAVAKLPATLSKRNSRRGR
jgi:hypothetical protein